MLYCTVVHTLGDEIQFCIPLNIFVLFVFFVDKKIFLRLRRLRRLRMDAYYAFLYKPQLVHEKHERHESNSLNIFVFFVDKMIFLKLRMQTFNGNER